MLYEVLNETAPFLSRFGKEAFNRSCPSLPSIANRTFSCLAASIGSHSRHQSRHFEFSPTTYLVLGSIFLVMIDNRFSILEFSRHLVTAIQMGSCVFYYLKTFVYIRVDVLVNQNELTPYDMLFFAKTPIFHQAVINTLMTQKIEAR